MLAPRRLAARAAAARMASSLGEAVGETVGYRVRMDAKVSARTRVEVITEGIFVRMALGDPELSGVAAVLFDEFHERSLDADLGLALALDIQQSLRPELRILPMSATLDDVRLAALLGDAPVVQSEGRVHPIETLYLGRRREQWIEDAMAAAIRTALADQSGGILAFLPGRGEIERTRRLLESALDAAKYAVLPLHGGLDPRAQDQAVQPLGNNDGRRKIVLATAIAETSLTIPDIRIVIDSGLARVPRFDPAVGLPRLVTERAPGSSVEQRRGRAGRTEPGVCYRLWDEAETRGLSPFPRPEIQEADLGPLALALADWGASDPGDFRWLDPPPPGPYAAALADLVEVGALDQAHKITAHGRALITIPAPPRQAHMIIAAKATGDSRLASRLAALLTERGLGGSGVDLADRVQRLAGARGQRAEAVRRMADRMARTAGASANEAIHPERAGRVLALAWPDRIARARGEGAFQMANGRMARVDVTDPLARAEWLVIADATARAEATRILAAAALSAEDVTAVAGDRIETRRTVRFDREAKAVQLRIERHLGRLRLHAQPGTPTPEEAAAGLVAAVQAHGLDILPWSDAAIAWLARARFVAGRHGDWPDLSEAGLQASADVWLAPALAYGRGLADIPKSALSAALHTVLDWRQSQDLDRLAPERLQLAGGSSVQILYEDETGPAAEIVIQDAFGMQAHPMLDGAPILLRLLSPARRPAQTTRDLPGFWAGSYHAVRADLRGRYPKHPWPDDPATAKPPVRRHRR